MDEAEAAGAEKATPQTWAAKKGMAERFLPTTGAFPIANLAYQRFAQARAFAAWADDTLVTEAEFDAAVIAAE